MFRFEFTGRWGTSQDAVITGARRQIKGQQERVSLPVPLRLQHVDAFKKHNLKSYSLTNGDGSDVPENMEDSERMACELSPA